MFRWSYELYTQPFLENIHSFFFKKMSYLVSLNSSRKMFTTFTNSTIFKFVCLFSSSRLFMFPTVFIHAFCLKSNTAGTFFTSHFVQLKTLDIYTKQNTFILLSIEQLVIHLVSDFWATLHAFTFSNFGN